MRSGYYNRRCIRFLAFARSKQSAIVALIRELVECESPSDQPPSVNRFVDLSPSRLEGLGNVRDLARRTLRASPALRVPASWPAQADRRQDPGAGRTPTPLAAGHAGARCRFGERAGRLWGPGVLDMKSGIAFFLFAMQALRELEIPVARSVVLQVNSDEEVGSESSRALTEEAARSKRRRAGAGARHGSRGKTQDRAQRRRRLHGHA